MSLSPSEKRNWERWGYENQFEEGPFKNVHWLNPDKDGSLSSTKDKKEAWDYWRKGTAKALAELNKKEKISEAPTTAVEFIDTAMKYVGGPRSETHGSKGLCFRAMDAADSFLETLRKLRGKPLAPGVESAIRMITYKICRIYAGSYNPDDYIDIAGYAGCAGEIAVQAEVDLEETTV